ncbi:ribonuclease P/MRP protein subunit POP5 isoform X3 [Periophthalmus magnuspinnatus]|uniref:ribonuclease P/MRP protein subunit POP5 isoform X3 n=1 Tax=Periophthalmus magnuspinnatus TaxID=409849 RepID=UPI0024368844|nr:ribonuclease P/MRP protein subunit POP5 isoform X3 [Periophthalmus magnuspinnatus]
MVRVKSRYLLCEVNVTDRNLLLLLDDRAVTAAVKDVVQRMHVKYLNAVTGIILLRFPKKCYKQLWSALPFITSIEARGKQISCFLNCIYVGGTIRTCQKFLIRYNAHQLRRMLPKCKSEEEKHNIQQAILDCCLTRTHTEEAEDTLESEEDE